MGKKGSWFSALKRVFTSNPSASLNVDPEKKPKKAKKPKKSRHGDTTSFIPLFREPSSIEKIFGDFEREQHTLRPPPLESFVTPTLALSPHPSPPPTPSPPAQAPPAPPPPRLPEEIGHRNHDASATRIQAAYRGHRARRSFRGLKGLVRLQGVVRGQNVKRQTVNAIKYMQLVVRVQSQIQSRRIQMLDAQARRHSPPPSSSAANDAHWDASLLSKDQLDSRTHKKVEAIVKRERAMAFAYSHQLWKATPQPHQTPPAAGGFPWWFNWLDRHLPPPSSDLPRPRSSKSTRPPPRSPLSTYSRASGGGAASPFEFPRKDNESLTSCPPFSAPNYMAPTVSAKAKARASSNPRERFMPTPDSINSLNSNSNRRLSFPLTPGISSFKGPSFFSTPTSTSRRTLDKHHSLLSVASLSVDSTVSMPAAMGVARKPFNRFV